MNSIRSSDSYNGWTDTGNSAIYVKRKSKEEDISGPCCLKSEWKSAKLEREIGLDVKKRQTAKYE